MTTCKCGSEVEQYDATAGGADSEYSRGAAGTFDYPVTVECEDCGRRWCDGDLVAEIHCSCGWRGGEYELEKVSVKCDPPSGVSSHCWVWICPDCKSESKYSEVDPREGEIVDQLIRRRIG